MKNLKSMLLTLILLPLMAVAQTSLYVITGSGTSFTATKSGSLVRTGAIQTVISAIKTDASGASVEIQFGNGTDMLDIGTAYIMLDGSAPGWNVTLSGKISSAHTSAIGVIYMTNGANVESKADIRNTYPNGYAISNIGNETLTVSGGTISAGNYSVYNYSTGSVVLGGSPIITGKIRAPLSIVTGSSGAFVPGEKIYTLDFANYTLGREAVTNGRDFVENFALINSSYSLIANNDNLVIASVEAGYKLEKRGTIYIVTETPTLSQYLSVQAAINAIRIAANGEPCEIQFGNGVDTLDIGTAYITLDGSAPGLDVTLSGKISSAHTSYVIYMRDGANAESKADIKGSHYAIYNNGSGTVTISVGTISGGYSAVYNASGTSTININGGTISGGTYAVNCGSNCSVALGGSPNITSDIRTNTGTLSVLTSGTNAFAPNDKIYTLNFAANVPNGIAVMSGANFLANFTLANDDFKFKTSNNDILIEYIGTSYKYSKSGNTYIITEAPASAMRIQDLIDAIKTDASGASVEIQFGNDADTLDISAAYITLDWDVTLSGKISSNASYVIYMANDANVESRADITGFGYAIYNPGTGTVTINGGTISGGTYAVYNLSGTININGGTISGGTYAVYSAYNGSVTLGGSPTITGDITTSAEKLSVITEGENAFSPENKVYSLSFNTYTPNGVAVINGKNFLANFKLSQDDYYLAINNGNLILNFVGFTHTKLAENTYMITKSTTAGGGYAIQNVISNIRIAANGASVEIQFGNGADTLNIGTTAITLDWDVTLSGKINSNAAYVIYMANDANVESRADITGFGYAIYNPGTGIVTINGGTISGRAYAVYNSSGTININGGTISGGTSGVYVEGFGVLNISGEPIINSANGYAISSYFGSISLGGSPTITGNIYTQKAAGNLSVIKGGGNAFVPNDKIYTLSFLSYDADSIAVTSGKDFLKNFAIANASWSLIANGNNLVLTTAEALCLSENKIWENNTCQTEAEIAEAACIAAGKAWVNGECTSTTPANFPQIAVQVRAQSTANAIMLENLPHNAKVEAYNLQGKQIYSATSHSPLATSLNIPVQTTGIYIVKVSLGSQKQILRGR